MDKLILAHQLLRASVRGTTSRALKDLRADDVVVNAIAEWTWHQRTGRDWQEATPGAQAEERRRVRDVVDGILRML